METDLIHITSIEEQVIQHTLQWTVEPAPGGFVRSLFYPADEANTNPNIASKT